MINHSLRDEFLREVTHLNLYCGAAQRAYNRVAIAANALEEMTALSDAKAKIELLSQTVERLKELEQRAEDTEKHYCAGKHCPGLRYKASDTAHPISCR